MSDEQDYIDSVFRDDPHFNERREVDSARKIRAVLTDMGDDQKLVHIAGYNHLCRDTMGRTLYEKLRDFHPSRRAVRSY